jgi:lia operon protein LiaG
MTRLSPRLSRDTTAIVLGIAALALASASARAQTERRTLSSDRVAIYNLAGRVSVEGGGGSDVGVEIRRGGSDARELRVESGDIRGVESLRIVYPSDRVVYSDQDRRGRTQINVRSDGTFGDSGDRGGSGRDRGQVEIVSSGSGLDAYADLRITVPRGREVAVYLAVGEVRVSNVDGDLKVDVASARVTSERTRGSLNLDTGSGGVSVTDAQGEVNLDTGSGGVTVNGIRGSSLKMDTGSGSISGGDIEVRELVADVGSGGIRLGRVRASRVSLESGSGGAELELLSAIDDLKVETGSGGVTLRVPASLDAEVDIETGSGGIDTDLPVKVTKWERRHLTGTIGNGRGRVHIEAGSGSVRLIKGSSRD